MLDRTRCKGLRVVQLIVSDAFAGSERYAVNLSVGLAGLGAEVLLIGGSSSRVRGALSRVAAQVSHLPATNVVDAWRLLRSIGQPDVVHAHLTSAEVAATITFAARRGVKIVSTRHIASWRGSNLPGRLASHWVRARLDGQLAPSQYVAARVDGACRVIPTGVANCPLGSHERPIVLVAQRLQPEKDTTTALRAWADSGLAQEGWQLHIAGSGGEEGGLKVLARDLGVERSCCFLGDVEDPSTNFSEAGLLLATATGDSFGLAVVEAMATGLPIVASAAGGHLETVAQVAGASLFPPGDYRLAADQLRGLVHEPERRRAYGMALREHQRHEHSLAKWVSRVSQWYEELLGAAAPTAPEG